jgi:hypothetical protein
MYHWRVAVWCGGKLCFTSLMVGPCDAWTARATASELGVRNPYVTPIGPPNTRAVLLPRTDGLYYTFSL